MRSAIEEQLALHIRASKLPAPVREFRFDEARKWRVDFAWPDRKLAVEVDGAVHRIEARFHADVEKHNALAFAGWTLIRVTGRMVRSGAALEIVMQALELTAICGWKQGIKFTEFEGLRSEYKAMLTVPKQCLRS